jgi:mevalonate kinase
VTGVFREREAGLRHGFDVEIRADFPSTVGLGSSAAVTVACAKALEMHLDGEESNQVLHELCLRVVRSVQGVGSGADLAASIAGGVVAYRVDPYRVESIHAKPPLVLVYSGSKTPTPEVVRIVESKRAQSPGKFDRLFDDMDGSIDTAIPAVRQGDWDTLGRLLDENQRRMKALGVSNRALDEIVSGLRESPGILGAKISGSGLGDCVVAVGDAELEDFSYEVIPVSVCTEGARIE